MCVRVCVCVCVLVHVVAVGMVGVQTIDGDCHDWCHQSLSH